MTLPFRLLLTVAAAGGAAADSVGASASCSGTQSAGVCLWPKQQAFANLSVAGDEDMGTACCSACSTESRCVSWLVYTERRSGYPAGTCILNDHQVMGQAPPLPSCISGHVSPKPWPAPPPVPAPPGAKNVLFFAVDDLRPEINAFGGGSLGPLIPGSVAPKMHTPHFDELAQSSLVLTKNYVQQAVCSPTRTSLLTGRRPDRTRVFDLYSYFRTVAANYTTIPEFFRLHGYETIGMGKIFHPGHASGSARAGSDDACCSWTNASAYFHAPNLGAWSGKDVASTHNDGKAWYSVPGPLEAKYPLPDNQTADHAVQTLKDLAKKHVVGAKPWFVAVGFHKPHLPFVASEQFFDDFYPPSEVELPPNQQPPEGMPPVAWSSYGEIRAYSDIKALNATGAPGTVLPKQDVLDLRRAYYASVTQTDFMLGKVMSELKSGPFASNTVVSIWGDHGWQLGEHGEWCKHTNFEYATRAPMMIHVPGLTDAGIVTTHYSEHVDLFPTLAEAAVGITLKPCPKGDASLAVALCTEGSSLVPLMKNPQTPVKTAAFSQYPRGYQRTPGRTNGVDNIPDHMYTTTGSDLFGGEMSTPSTSPCIMDREATPGCTMGYTMVTRLEGSEYRYTEWADFNTPGYELKVDWNRNVGIELYNHSSDPGENFNLNATQQGNAVIHSLSAKLSALLRAGPSYGNPGM